MKDVAVLNSITEKWKTFRNIGCFSGLIPHNHARLISNLHSYGGHTNALRLFLSYLINRQGELP